MGLYHPFLSSRRQLSVVQSLAAMAEAFEIDEAFAFVAAFGK